MLLSLGLGLALAASPSAPAAASAPGSSSTVSKPGIGARSAEERAEFSGFRLAGELDHTVGQGTFVNPAYYALATGTLALVPSYAFKLRSVKLSASASLSLSWEYSLPDNLNGRRVDYSDLRFSLAAPVLYKEKWTGITVSPSIGATVPISLSSWNASTLTVLSGTLALARSFSRFDVGYRFAIARGFHGNPLIAQRASDATDAQGNRLCLFRPGETLCTPFGTNTQLSLSNRLEASYQATQKLSVGLGLGLLNAFRYPISEEAVDAYTPRTVDSNGALVARQVGRYDRLSASLSASYTLTDQLSLSGGVSTDGPPKTKDGQRFRFPFYDFVSPADNLTTFSVTLSALL